MYCIFHCLCKFKIGRNRLQGRKKDGAKITQYIVYEKLM